MSPTSPNPTPSETRRFSINLPHWGWFLLPAVVLLASSVGVSVWWPYHQEQEVIRKIESYGGSVEVYLDLDGEEDCVGPPWLRYLVGHDRMKKFAVFKRVNRVELGGTKVTDAEIVQLRQLTNLHDLFLNDTAITDAGLGHLSKLTSLRMLVLYGTPVTDAGLVHLKTMARLAYLSLADNE